MTKAELIKALERCGDHIPVLVAAEYSKGSGVIMFFEVEGISISNSSEFPTLINITVGE